MKLLFDQNLSFKNCHSLADLFPGSSQVQPPPKVIWLRCGNQATAFIETLLRSHIDAISSFGLEAPAACLEIY